MAFMTGLTLLIDLKDNSYDAILIIVDYLIIIIYYKSIKIIIALASLVEVIISMVLRHHSLH